MPGLSVDGLCRAIDVHGFLLIPGLLTGSELAAAVAAAATACSGSAVVAGATAITTQACIVLSGDVASALTSSPKLLGVIDALASDSSQRTPPDAPSSSAAALPGQAYLDSNLQALRAPPKPLALAAAAGLPAGGGPPSHTIAADNMDSETRGSLQYVRLQPRLTVVVALWHGRSVRLIPASHRAAAPRPAAVTNAADPLELTVAPELAAGDCLVLAAGVLWGLAPTLGGCADYTAAVLSCEFAGSNSRPAAGIPAEWVAELRPGWVEELSEIERAVVGLLPIPGAPGHATATQAAEPRSLLSDGEQVQLGPPGGQIVIAEALLRPERPPQPAFGAAADPTELYLWDLNGYLAVPGVLDAREVAEALAAVEASLMPGATDIINPIALPLPHGAVFRRLLTHPAVIARLAWMCGPGFRASYGGRMVCWDRGVGGQALHGDPTDFSATQNYSYYSFDAAAGRASTGSVNVAWQFTPVTERDGGFVCVKGSHKATVRTARGPDGVNGLLPYGESWAAALHADVHDPTGSKGVVHPTMSAGTALFFCGGATLHGSVPCPEHAPNIRRTFLTQYVGRDINLAGPPQPKL